MAKVTTAVPAALLLAASLLCSMSAAEAAKRPNLLFAMADQMRFDVMSSVLPGAATPNLDALARDGVRFTNAYSTTPTCTPARSAILTGQKPWNHGLLGAGAVAQSYAFEMPSALSSVGYQTTSLGKDHFGWERATDEGNPHGYQKTDLYDGIVSEQDNYHSWFKASHNGREPETGWPTLDMNSWRGAAYVLDEQYHPTAWVGQNTVNFLNNRSAETEPFFLKVSFHRPHSPYDPPQRVLDTVKPEDLPPMYQSNDGWDDRFRGGPGNAKGCGPGSSDAWCGIMPDNATLLARRSYYGSVRFVDEWFGKVLDTLKKRGLYNDTLIIWTSDHGDGQGDHHHWRKGFPYEFSTHVPMIFKWPAAWDASVTVRKGSTLPHVTELRDVFPTMLDAAGANDVIPANYSMDGDSLFCLVKTPDGSSCRGGKWREWIDLEHDLCYNETNHWNALTDGHMKYIFKAWNASEQLFNLTADPREQQELQQAPAYQAQLLMWRQRMVQQFEAEGRGAVWVVNGTLSKRARSQMHSPNYPSPPSPPPLPGQTCDPTNPALRAGVVLGLMTQGNEAVGASDGERAALYDPYCQDMVWGAKGDGSLRLEAKPDLCIVEHDGAEGIGLPSLVSAECSAVTAQQLGFHVKWNSTDPEHGKTQPIVHVASGLCVGALSAHTGIAGVVVLEQCKEEEPGQGWVFGSSGRFCQKLSSNDDNICLTLLAPKLGRTSFV